MLRVDGRRPVVRWMLGMGRARLTICLTLLSVAISNTIAFAVCRLFFPDMAFGPAWYMTATLVPMLAAPFSFFVIITLLWEIETKNQILRRLIHLDDLTATFNRRHFREETERLANGLVGRGDCVSLILLDIDFFKKINDQHGHAGGDATLVEIARRCQRAVRRDDIVTRFGGEEFVILLPRTDTETAGQIAERVRAAICETPIVHDGGTITATASLGIACSSEIDGSASVETLLRIADTRLYRAKAGGRNRVVAAEEAA